MNTARMRWLAGGAALAAGLVGPGVIGASAASAQTAPPTLSGELLIGGGGIDNTCGDTGSFSITVSGDATGPYPGTFTESVSGTVQGNGNPISATDTVQSLTATFTINSPTGTVTGTKTLTNSVYGCYHDSSNFAVQANTAYQATIHTSTGNYTDQGTAFIQATSELFSGTLFPGVYEPFSSSQTQPTLIEPTSRNQCMNGGWMNYPQFKNQGQCVAYVANSQGGS